MAEGSLQSVEEGGLQSTVDGRQRAPDGESRFAPVLLAHPYHFLRSGDECEKKGDGRIFESVRSEGCGEECGSG